MLAHTRKRRPVRDLIGLLILIIAVLGPATVYAQVAAAGRVTPVATIDSAAVEAAAPVRLLVGRSTVIDVGRPIARVSLTSADVADAHVTGPNELLVNGKVPGTISMFVWDRTGGIRRYEVTVARDLTRLEEQLKQLFPGEPIELRANGKSAVLSGIVSSKDVADKAASLARSFVDTKEELISLLQAGPDAPSNQVLLRVRFAEVSRSAMTELGLGLFTSPTGIENTIGRVTTQQFAAPSFDELKSTKDSNDFGSDVTSASGKFTFSDFLNLFLYSQKYDLGLTIRALQTRGLFQSLAEPNLVAESGKEASFLAGGEFPIPVAQSSSSGTSITVQFKEFGVRLNFTPTVNGNRVRLKVRPEVSTLDFNNAITLNGFRIPALSTRRTETEVELNNGQTFAIAGLINNNMISSVQKVPGLGDIPILGLLFRSKAAQKNLTELVVLITPEILPLNSPGVTPNLPRLMEPYLPPLTDRQVRPSPPPAFQAPAGTRTQTVAPAPNTQATSAPSATVPASDARPSPAEGAAALKAQSGATRTVINSPDPVPATAGAQPATALQNTATPAASVTLSPKEREAAERARKDDIKVRTEVAKRSAQQADVDRRRKAEDDERLARLAKAQAQRDAEAAARAAEAAKKQAEIDRKKQKAEAEAAAKLRAAQAAYTAELDRLQRR